MAHTKTTCIYCGSTVEQRDYPNADGYYGNPARHVPARDEDWQTEAAQHAPDCEWVRTRAHSED